MTQTVSGGLDALRQAMSGALVGPDDPAYDELRRVWNADVDRRPVAIARCADADDVSAVVRYAAERGVEVTVRGGAHHILGASVADGAVMIDLTALDAVTVDPAARTALVGGGATLAQLDAATQEFGLATPAGTVGHTGVAGLTLIGGMGWLTRKHGLAIDNLLSVRIVTADGRVRRAAADENPDLFWAVRGGGGNFGVITEFEFRLHQVDPIVQFGMFFWQLDQGGDALRLARDLFPDLPADLILNVAGIHAPPAPFVPADLQGVPGYALLLVGFGAEAEHARVADRIRAALPPAFDAVMPLPYVALQQLFDESMPFGLHAYEKGHYLELNDGAIEALTATVPGKPSPLSAVFCQRLDGAYSAVPDDATAFGGGRSPRLQAFIIGLTPDPAGLAAERAWVRSVWEALRPHALSAESYANGVGPGDGDRVRATYGAKYDRLAAIKAVHDPGNLFRHNANIVPAPPA